MDKDRHIDIMGIVNLTDDSFYSHSRSKDVARAVALAGRHVEEGASIIDFGACSSRPGASSVGPEEEWIMLRPALEAFRKDFPDVRISVDTYWSEVVQRVYDLIGDFIVNDISAGEDDPLMLPSVGKLGLAYVAMHKRGTPRQMQSLTSYNDITEDLLSYFTDFADKAERFGVHEWILDPGFGFAKTVGQNYELLRNLGRFRSVGGGRKVLVGVSRKSMIYKPLCISPEESLASTQVVNLAALQNGADILRVHDTLEAGHTLSLYRLL